VFDPDEVWREVPEAPTYSISPSGAIRNEKTGRILKGGYQVALRDEGKTIRVSRMKLRNRVYFDYEN